MTDNPQNPDNSEQQPNPNGGQPSNPMDDIRKFIESIIKEISANIKNFVDKKYKHDYAGQLIYSGMVIIVLATIVLLALTNRIGETIIGTLLGSTIGYAIGKYSHNNKSNKD